MSATSQLNAFELLGFIPRPWLEPDAVQKRVAARMAATGAKPELIRELDQARQLLLEPRLRLQHLLELKWQGKKPASDPAALPKILEAWFEEATKLDEKLNVFFARKDAAPSPLNRALLAREAMLLREEAEDWLVRLTSHEAEWLAALREWDARWQGENPEAQSYEMLALFVQTFAYLGRWREAVHDRSFALLEV